MPIKTDKLDELLSSPEVQKGLEKAAKALQGFLSKQSNREELLKQLEDATTQHVWFNTAKFDPHDNYVIVKPELKDE